MKVLCIFVSLVVATKAGYHEEVGIFLAARIKAAENKSSDEVPEMVSRVVGGAVTSMEEHPYLVGLVIQLKIGLTSICGSSLVTAIRLITAAHCLMGVRSVEAVLGSQQLFNGGTRITTNVFVIHPGFDLDHSTDNDIGVVKLPRPVKFSAKIKPIRLPNNNMAEVVGEWATAAGWGKTSDRLLNVPENVQRGQVTIKILPAAVCQNEYLSTLALRSIICTSGAGRKGTCSGDSGGPLVVARNGQKLLVGITSYGDNRCEAGKPSAFTRVASYLEFINKHLA